jgi:hypothetical protein
MSPASAELADCPCGTENASIFATVRGSIPNRHAASARLSPFNIDGSL